MQNESPYFTLSGLAFKESGTPLERELNLKYAVETLYNYIVSGGSQSDVMVAIDHIEWTNPQVKYLTTQLKNYLFLDEEVTDEFSKRMVAKLYNLIADKVS